MIVFLWRPLDSARSRTVQFSAARAAAGRLRMASLRISAATNSMARWEARVRARLL